MAPREFSDMVVTFCGRRKGTSCFGGPKSTFRRGRSGFTSKCRFRGRRSRAHFLLSLFICFPGWVLVVGFPAGLSPTSFHLSPRLGACGRLPGRLVSHFLSFVSHFFSGCGPVLFFCLPVLFICLPHWVLVVGFPAGLSPISFHLSPAPGWVLVVVGFPAGLSPTSFHLSPRLGACGRLPGLVRGQGPLMHRPFPSTASRAFPDCSHISFPFGRRPPQERGCLLLPPYLCGSPSHFSAL